MINIETLRAKILSQKPTKEQEDAIFTNDLEYVLRATPGSGKTWTSSRRFIWRGVNSNYKVGGLALLSFTNTAINEFYHATSNIGLRELLSDPNYVGTLDSFVERFIINPFGHLINGSKKRLRLLISPFPSLRANSSLQTYIRFSDGKQQKVSAWDISPVYEDGKLLYSFKYAISKSPVISVSPNPFKELFALGYYTHSQRIYLAYRILLAHDNISTCLAKRFPEIIVDEAQDTNTWLLILLNLLREKGSKITLVGDPDQCIYEFAKADATSIPTLKERWHLQEKPLSRSFRCNDAISNSVRMISGNLDFYGCGQINNEFHKAFIVRESSNRFDDSITNYLDLIEKSHISLSTSAILCRGHEQLDSISGIVNFNNLQGNTKVFAKAAFYRDLYKDYKKAFDLVKDAIAEIIEDKDLEESILSTENFTKSNHITQSIWNYIKSDSKLPSIYLTGEEWVNALRISLIDLFTSLGVTNVPSLGHKLNKKGLDDKQLVLPLFSQTMTIPHMRKETIHKVKGESLDSVLLLGASKFYNDVIKAITNSENTEERRLAYVAMTRARNLLVIGLPATHFDNYYNLWASWGFIPYP